MVLLMNLAPQEMGDPLSGHEVAVDRPVQRRTVFSIDPVLSHAGSENRMLHVEEKYAVFLQRPMDVFKNGIQILNIVQRQIGDHTVPCRLRIRIFPDPTHLIADSRSAVAAPGLLNHLLTQVDTQHLPGTLFRGKLTVPSIAAA